MGVVENAIESQLRNIEAKTGQTRAQLADFVRRSGLSRHGEICDLLKRELGLGHGDANSLAHACRKAESGPGDAAAPGPDGAADAMYTGAKAALRPIHDRLMAALRELGDFEVSPKKGYVSLRRKKQFATIGPATQTRVEVGLNLKGVPATDRLAALPAGGICQYKVKVTGVDEVDTELLGWLRQAYDSAG